MQRIDAVKEARIAALTHGGTWYVIEKKHNYSIVRNDEYHTKLGRIVDKYDAARVRSTTPPSFPQAE